MFAYWASWQVKTQVAVVTALSVDDAAEKVMASFPRFLWKRVDGLGQINYQRRQAKYPGPVLSVDFEPTGSGTEIQIWMSSWTTAYLMVVGGEHAYLQRRRMIKQLTDGDPVRID